MALFLGEFVHQLDDRSRVSLPARFRELLAKEPEQTIYIVPGFDACLYVMPAAALERLHQRLSMERTEWNDLGRSFRANLTARGSIGTLDAQGRLTLTDKQVAYAGLEGQVVVVGNMDRIEIWQEARYREHLDRPGTMNLGMSELAAMFLRDGGSPTRDGGK